MRIHLLAVESGARGESPANKQCHYTPSQASTNLLQIKLLPQSLTTFGFLFKDLVVYAFNVIRATNQRLLDMCSCGCVCFARENKP